MSRAQGFVIGQFILFGIFGIAWLLLPGSSGTLVRLLGLGIGLAAAGVLFTAVLEHQQRNRALPNVAPTPNAHVGLIESGIYKTVRHPIYTSVLLGTLGLSLLNGNLVLFILFAIFVGFFTIKSRYEETLLRQIYPTYSDYMQRTGRFLPFL